MRIFRVVLAAQGVVSELGPTPIAAIQHVCFVVAERREDVHAVLLKSREQAIKGVLKDGIPSVEEEVVSTLPVWTVKVGPPPREAAIFVAVPCEEGGGAPMKAALLAHFADSAGVRKMIEDGLYAVNPRPISVKKAGVW